MFILLVSIFSTLTKLPLEVCRILYIDARYQSNNQFKHWIIDQFKAFIFSLALGLPIVGTTLAILVWDVRFQWFLTCLFVSAVALFFSDVYSGILKEI